MKSEFIHLLFAELTRAVDEYKNVVQDKALVEVLLADSGCRIESLRKLFDSPPVANRICQVGPLLYRMDEAGTTPKETKL